MSVVNLFGMDIPEPKSADRKKTKKIIDKAKNPKTVKASTSTSIKSKKLSIPEKLHIINENVDKTLGIYKDTTVVIKSRDELFEYIDKAVANNIIAVDTETNNSLDPLTCKLMGLCLYTPGMNSAYVPVNHTDLNNNRLDWQVTESDIAEALNKINNINVLTHNGKFDYQVIYCTCGVKIPITWDSMVGAKILDENEHSAGLKQQYIDKIDSSIEKYSIDELFNAIEYNYVDPEVFALYAATDSYMTYKLYEYQLQEFSKQENKRLYELFLNIEIPITTVVAEMELTGVCIDKDYAERLSKKYHKKYEELEKKIEQELKKYDAQIAEWRKTDEANYHPPKSTGKGLGKSKSEQLDTPVAVTSPLQLAILLYDVLKVKSVSKKSPRGTGEDVLKKINLPICDLILEQRGLLKLINTYIDKLPECISERDGRLHAHFNQYGASTGRFSCISEGTKISSPSGDKNIEDMQPGDWVYCYDDNNRLTLSKVKNRWYTGVRECVKLTWISKYNHSLTGELICTPDHFIKTVNGWKMAKDLTPSDSILYVHRRVDEHNIALYANNGQGAEEEHVWIKKNIFGCYDSDIHLHHCDGNHKNNNPDNLTLVNPKVHHNAHLYSDGNWNGAYNFSYDDLMKMGESVNWELTQLEYDYCTLRGWFEKYQINYIEKYTESYSKRRFKKSRHGTLMKNKHMPLSKGNLIYALELSEGNIAKGAGYFGVSSAEFESACEKNELLSNHNITSIEYLTEPFNVFDLEIEGHHNFIANELCVHNSSDPNLQNIPSHNNEIRMIFTASDGYVMVGGDFSQQEPRLLAHYSGDEHMIEAYKENKDLYASIAAKVYHNNYEDNREFRPDGSMNPDGKKRRTSVKSLLLGIMYGMSTASIAAQLNCDIKEAEDIKSGFFKEFPKVAKWINETQTFAKINGYVEDVWGRRRRLPDISLPRYEVKGSENHNFNPMLYTSGINKYSNTDAVDRYLYKLNNSRSRKEVEDLKAQALREDIKIKDNSGFVAQAERQCVNARIQGGAASMSKRAMINVFNNEELRQLGFRLLIVVHDEIIGECPKENQERCKELLSQVMINSALPEVQVPMKCDVDSFNSWYEDVYNAELSKEYKNLLEKHSPEQAQKLIIQNHNELKSEKIIYILENM